MSWKLVLLVAALNILFAIPGIYALIVTFGAWNTLGLWLAAVAAYSLIGMLLMRAPPPMRGRSKRG